MIIRGFMVYQRFLLWMLLSTGFYCFANPELFKAVHQGNFEVVQKLLPSVSCSEWYVARDRAHNRWKDLFILMKNGYTCPDVSQKMFNCHKMCRELFKMPEHMKPYEGYSFAGTTISFDRR